MEEIQDEIKKKLNEKIIQLKIDISKYIFDSYLKFTENKVAFFKEDIEGWKNSITNNINNIIDKSFEYLIKKQDIDTRNKSKTEIRIESKSELNDIFTSKDIQEKNKEITRNFQNETYDYMNANEKNENENVASFLKEVAIISRISFKEGKNLYQTMKENYLKSQGNINIIEDEKFQNDFSTWVKNKEKNDGIKIYEDILNKVKLFKNNEKSKGQNYLSKLFLDLTIMYFHCNIAFPLVEISFKNEENNFNSETMIDFINRGKNRKVNFVILPALISNGIFLQNGKLWVFTFSKNTFKFDESINKYLNDFLIHDKNLILKNIQENLILKVYCKNKNGEKHIKIKTNIDIPEDIEYEYSLFFKNKNKRIQKIFKNKTLKIKNNLDIEKVELILEKKIIISSNGIINEN